MKTRRRVLKLSAKRTTTIKLYVNDIDNSVVIVAHECTVLTILDEGTSNTLDGYVHGKKMSYS